MKSPFEIFGPMLPAWASNPDRLLRWVEANAMMISLVSGVVITVFLIVCFFLGRKISQWRKPKEFGRDVWTTEAELRSSGRAKKEF